MNSTLPTARGWYLADEVGQLAGVPGDRIGQWARRGYIRSSRSTRAPRVYSYQDVAEAMVVHELLDRGVPSREVRAAVENLRARYGDWPLTAAPLATTESEGPSGRSRLVLVEGTAGAGGQFAIGRGDGSQLFLPNLLHLREIVALLRRGGWALRKAPHITHIEVNPNRLSGHPTIRDRRVPVEKVALLAQTPSGRELLQSDYDLSTAEIDDAVQWLAAVREYRPAA